jgi:hypothetical protein
VRIAGPNATKKHNEVVKYLAHLCDDADVDAQMEPRDLEAFRCHSCAATIPRQQKEAHHAICRANFSRTGPDLRVFWPSGSVVYDVTIVHTTAPSHAHTEPSRIVADKVAAKNALYGPLLGDEPFVVLPARALGTIEKPLRDLVVRLSVLAERKPADVMEGLSVVLARGVGLSLVEARRPSRR